MQIGQNYSNNRLSFGFALNYDKRAEELGGNAFKRILPEIEKRAKTVNINIYGINQVTPMLNPLPILNHLLISVSKLKPPIQEAKTLFGKGINNIKNLFREINNLISSKRVRIYVENKTTYTDKGFLEKLDQTIAKIK